MHRYTVRAPRHVPRLSLGAYTRRAFSLLPESVIREAFRSRDVKMDGQRCSKETVIKPGAEVALYTAYDAPLPVVYEDDRLLAIDKPAGVSCDQDAYGSVTATDWARLYAKEAFAPRLCHRLDTLTSGLLLFAKDEAAEVALKQMFAEHAGDKTYVCLVRGMPAPESAICTAWLEKDAKRAAVQIRRQRTEAAKQIVTAYETLVPGPVSLLKIGLQTGRTHQIRAHMAYLGWPVLGDDQYGDRDFNRRYGAGKLMLRSVGLRIETGGALPECDGIALGVPYLLDETLARILQNDKKDI